MNRCNRLIHGAFLSLIGLFFVALNAHALESCEPIVGQLASAQPYVAGGLVLDAIICVIIGGTRLMGGEGSLGRTALGVAFIAILNSGLLNLGLTDAYYQVYKGAILLGVLAVQIWLRRLAEASMRRGMEREAMDLAEATA